MSYKITYTPEIQNKIENLSKKLSDYNTKEDITNINPVPYCLNCGNNTVLLDAFARWDNETQDWILHQTFDDSFCNTCKQECTYEFG